MGRGTAHYHGFKAVQGAFWVAMEETANATWLGDVASTFTTDQPSEEYPWLGQNPAMKLWDGERSYQELRGDRLVLINDDYEGTIEFKRSDFRRDKTGQLQARVGELADRAAQLPQKLISTLLLANGTDYTGGNFFSSHTVGAGTFNNQTTTNIGTPTAPTTAEMVAGILTALNRFQVFTDDQGEPMHEFARGFTIMVPPNMWTALIAALGDQFTSSGVSNTIAAVTQRGYSMMPVSNPRLGSTAIFYVFRNDARIGSMIYQEELVNLEVLGPDSEHAKKTNKVMMGAHIVSAAGYGRPEMVVQHTFT